MQSRALTIRLVRLAMAASLLVPFFLFAFASWNSYRNIWSLTDERLVRSLDVQREQANKAFEIIDLTLNNAMELVSGMSSEDIRREEPRLYSQFKKFSDTIPVVQSLWVYDEDGHAAVSSRVHPPPTQSFSDRDFYLAHLKEDSGTY
jgi:two-component system NtrC family sensor kinase